MPYAILGCGDIGRRIARELIESGHEPSSIVVWVRQSQQLAADLGLDVRTLDLDTQVPDLSICKDYNLIYTIAPQKQGVVDERSRALLVAFEQQSIIPKRVVLVSTTGVYGDHQGQWVDEQTATVPVTERGQRRLDSERVWSAWADVNGVPLVILRVPGIYAYSRLPVERIKKGIPVVNPAESGFTNRIHADDLACVCIASVQSPIAEEVFNVTDGTPGTISEYLQEAAKVLGLPALTEISMAEAKQQLSPGMLSYLGESRKISNKKLLQKLDIELRYPDFRDGIKH